MSTLEVTNTKDLSMHKLKALIIGQSGSGKTALARTIAERCLVISAESGTLSLKGADIDVYDMAKEQDIKKRYALIQAVFSYLKTDEAKQKYQWIFLDSITEIAQILVAALKAKYPSKSDSMSLWGEYNDAITALIKSFRDLQDYHVVFTALQSVDKDENHKRFYGVDMPGSIAGRIDSMFDEVFTLRVIEDEKGNSKRALLTSRQDSYVAKDRSGVLSLYEKADLDAIKRKILS